VLQPELSTNLFETCLGDDGKYAQCERKYTHCCGTPASITCCNGPPPKDQKVGSLSKASPSLIQIMLGPHLLLVLGDCYCRRMGIPEAFCIITFWEIKSPSAILSLYKKANQHIYLCQQASLPSSFFVGMDGLPRTPFFSCFPFIFYYPSE